MVIDPETYVFNFGKYKGKTYEEVVKEDINYIRWCDEWIDWFTISPQEHERFRSILGLTLVQYQISTPSYKRRYYWPPPGTGGYAEDAEIWFGNHNCYGI